MKVLYFKRKSALLGLLLLMFILVAGYSLVAGSGLMPRTPAPAAPASDRNTKEQSHPDLLTVMPDLTRQEFFVECRLSRDRMRSQQMETLKEIAGQSNSSGEIRDSAQRELMQLSENMSKETELEKLVMARGFNDAAVMILPRSATVIVQVRSVTPPEVDQIKSLVIKTTNLDAGSIFVIPKP